MFPDEPKASSPLLQQEKVPERADLVRLLRDSQILASVVRRTLEADLLREVSAQPLSPSQFQLVRLMVHRGCRSVRQAADLLGVSPAAASKSVDKLVRLGIVIRGTNGDRRAARLSLTDEGRRLARRYEGLKNERLAGVLESFQPDELEKLSDLLERFCVSVLSRSGHRARDCRFCGAYIGDECPIDISEEPCPYLKALTHNPTEPL